MLKKFITLLFSFIFILNLNVCAKEENFQKEDAGITVRVMSEKVEFEDQKPILKNNRTLIPIRGDKEKMGAEVIWNTENQTVTVKDENNVVLITVVSNVIVKNGEDLKTDVAPEIINDRTFLPVRAIAEALDWEVFWGSISKTVSLYKLEDNTPFNETLKGYIKAHNAKAYIILEFFSTEYGTLMYRGLNATPSGSGYFLNLYDENMNIYDFYENVPPKTRTHDAIISALSLSDDDKILKYSVYFDTAYTDPYTNEKYHDAGTYHYEANLETREHKLVLFEPSEN